MPPCGDEYAAKHDRVKLSRSSACFGAERSVHTNRLQPAQHKPKALTASLKCISYTLHHCWVRRNHRMCMHGMGGPRGSDMKSALSRREALLMGVLMHGVAVVCLRHVLHHHVMRKRCSNMRGEKSTLILGWKALALRMALVMPCSAGKQSHGQVTLQKPRRAPTSQPAGAA